MNRIPHLVAAAVASLAVASPAQAYLDPGTGSMLLQLLFGGLAGALVIGKLYWSKIKSVFRPDPVNTPESPREHGDSKATAARTLHGSAASTESSEADPARQG